MKDKATNRIWAVLLAVMIAVTFMPYQTYAESKRPEKAVTARPAAKAALGFSSGPATGSAENKLADSDVLLMQYLGNGVGGGKQTRESEKFKYGRVARRERLTANEKLVYDSLKTQIENVAAGKRSNTVFTVPVKQAFGDKIKKSGSRWAVTKAALGVDSVVDARGNVTQAAVEAFYDILDIDGFRVLDALIWDLSYDFYWFDKTVDYWYDWGASSKPGWNYSEIYFDAEPSMAFTLHVSADYSVSGRIKTTMADTGKTAAASTCVNNVRQIIADNADKSNENKIRAYKNKICDLTDYNHKAAADTDPVYGDPWQLIWVFDNDPSTNVVCEGYSKAFQFLCDNSALGSIECYTITGRSVYDGESGGHMWNILHMEDGRNYIADLTNCDGGTAEQSDNELFLAGAAGGDPEDGYSFSPSWSKGKILKYEYDKDTLNLFDDKELILSFNAYGSGAGCAHGYGSVTYKWSSGYKYMTAKRTCGSDGYIDAETVRVTVTNTAATCEKAGNTNYSARFTNGAFAIQTRNVTGDAALGHDTVKVDAKAATIKKTGNKKHWKCSRCGKRFSDSAGKHKISKESVTIAKLPEVRGKDGTRTGKGASAATADYAITNLAKNKDPAGSAFAPLMLKSVKQTKSSITLKWNKNDKAVKYVIYGNRCGNSRKPEKLAIVRGSKKTIGKIAGSKLKKGAYYRFIVVALNSKDRVVSTSKMIYVATKGRGNYTKISTKAKKNEVVLKKGKTFRLKGKASGRNVKKYAAVRYESSKPSVATVTVSGKIKAAGKGSCKIYVYAQSGLRRVIKVTVK